MQSERIEDAREQLLIDGKLMLDIYLTASYKINFLLVFYCLGFQLTHLFMVIEK
jgi:hypothetical protein